MMIDSVLANPLSETAFGQGLVVRGKHFLIVEPPASSAASIIVVGSQQLYMHPLATSCD